MLYFYPRLTSSLLSRMAETARLAGNLTVVEVDFFLGYLNFRDTLWLEFKIYQVTVFCNQLGNVQL